LTITSTLNSGGSGGSGNVTYTSAFASPPASPASGDLWLPTDSFYIFRYSGSAWIPWGPVYSFTDPTVSGPTTWVNQGSATVSTANGAIVLTMPAGNAAFDYHIRVKTAPATPYVITAAILPGLWNNASFRSGLLFRESGSGKFSSFEFATSGAKNVEVNEFASPTSYSSTPFSGLPWAANGTVIWMRIADDGTNRKYSLSSNGQTWMQLYSETRTTYITADQVGFWGEAESVTFGAQTTLLSWKET